ncbi:calcyphosin-like protein [Periophthalmus magnuspinnatus]|uniref:calcyphosin-like protein n=1 Tax=Periophthalmus magnuspinnatus TaxID=409849 RepID=UPI00145BE49C|nr:calcyphosin-like protein [Periophthalmus magnuspinnatus]
MSESDTVAQIRLKLFPDGDTGFMKLFGAFRKIVKKNSYTLNSEEFEQYLKNAGLSLETEEVAAVFKEFDRDGNGAMDVNEFFIALRPPMSEYRKKVITEVFQKIDKTGDGVITIEDLKNEGIINTTFCLGSVDEALSSFLKVFETLDGKDAKARSDYY